MRTDMFWKRSDVTQGLISQLMLLKTKQKLKDSPRWRKEPDTRSLVSPTMSSGT
jgi:hypothetical protein